MLVTFLNATWYNENFLKIDANEAVLQQNQVFQNRFLILILSASKRLLTYSGTKLSLVSA